MALTREAQLARDGGPAEEGADLVIPLSFASEQPYERWWGVEILDCSPESVILDRLQDGGPLLFNHQWDELLGHHVPGTVRVDADRVCRADVAVAWAADDGKTIRMIEGGHLTKTSVGYEIITVLEQTTSKAGERIERQLDGRAFESVVERAHRDTRGDVAAFRRALDRIAGPFERAEGEPMVYRVVKWHPLENSLVTVPADTSVGVGRNLDTTAAEPQPITPNPATTLEVIMTDALQVAADKAAEIAAAEKRAAQSAADAARAAISEIMAIGDQFAEFDGPALARAAISAGKPVDVFRRELMEEISKRGKRWQPEVGMSKNEAQGFSLMRALEAMATGDWSKAGLERAASDAVKDLMQRSGITQQGTGKGFFVPIEVQKRDLVVGTATAGGNAVATNLRPQDFISLLRARTLGDTLGVRRLTGLVGNVDITRQTGAATAYWVGENAAGTESQQTLGLMQLRPKGLVAYTEVGRLLRQQMTPDADAFVMDDLAKQMGLARDLALFAGTGASNQPTGILSTAGIGSVTGTSLGYAGALEFQTDVAGANALVAGCRYVTTPIVAALLATRQRFASTDTPIWTGNILDGQVAGFQAHTSTQIPAGTMIFGDFSEVVEAEWGVLEIDVNPYANFQAGTIGIRAFSYVDIGVRTAGAFSAASSIT